MLYMPYGHSIQTARKALVGNMLIIIANKAKNAMSTIMNAVPIQLFTGRMY